MNSKTTLRISDFEFVLPPDLIAQRPLPRRDESRMMIVDRSSGLIRHGKFADLPGILSPRDFVVLNDARVLPARAWGSMRGTRIEFLFIREVGPGLWEVLCRPARRVRTGETVCFSPALEAVVSGRGKEGLRLLRFEETDVPASLESVGYAPLPPYIKRLRDDPREREQDLERYQTIFARAPGAVAAPTAGLHFSQEVIKEIEAMGIEMRFLTLDVGLATFQPVRGTNIADHRMLEETYTISAPTALAINTARAEGRPVTAVGTTVVRALESAWEEGIVRQGRRTTSLFIRSGFEFQVVDRLLTNFHLPKSTLLMLVAAFTGQDLLMKAYRDAVENRYRFYSYGDCMLIL